MDKKSTRIRRARRTRAKIRELGVARLCVHRTPRHIYAQIIAPTGDQKIRELGVARLCVHRTPRHIYAQIIAPTGDQTLASASTLDKKLSKSLKGTGNVAAAQAVGKAIAEMARKAGIERVAFDRSGFQYHGRVKALADAARENGLQF